MPIKNLSPFLRGGKSLKNIISHNREKPKNTPNWVALCLGIHDHWHYANAAIPKIPKSLMGGNTYTRSNQISLVKDNGWMEPRERMMAWVQFHSHLCWASGKGSDMDRKEGSPKIKVKKVHSVHDIFIIGKNYPNSSKQVIGVKIAHFTALLFSSLFLRFSITGYFFLTKFVRQMFLLMINMFQRKGLAISS